MITALLAIFAGVGILLIALAVPLMRRSVPPNGWYGLRVAATFADEWVWYEANAQHGRDLFILGVLQILTAVIPASLGVSEMPYTIANIATVFLGTIALAIIGIRRANRLRAHRAALLQASTPGRGESTPSPAAPGAA
jgi:uncharacterized membrane protein